MLGLGGDDSPVVDEPVRGQVAQQGADVRARPRRRRRDRRARGPAWRVEVTEAVVAEGRRVTHVAVKVRTATFFTRSRISKLSEPSTDPTVVASTALTLPTRFEGPGRPVRLLGVRVVLEEPGAATPPGGR